MKNIKIYKESDSNDRKDNNKKVKETFSGTLGELIKEERLNIHYSRTDLFNALTDNSQQSPSYSSVLKWESGRAFPSTEILIAIISIFKWSSYEKSFFMDISNTLHNERKLRDWTQKDLKQCLFTTIGLDVREEQIARWENFQVPSGIYFFSLFLIFNWYNENFPVERFIEPYIFNDSDTRSEFEKQMCRILSSLNIDKKGLAKKLGVSQAYLSKLNSLDDIKNIEVKKDFLKLYENSQG